MPGTTPSGLPYPLPTEPVRDGAAAIQALAVAVDRYASAPFCRVTLANAALPGSGATGWGCTAEIADPSGALVAAPAGITVAKAGIYVVTFTPNITGTGAVQMSIRVGDPNTGAVIGQGTGIGGHWDSATGILWAPSPTSVHPSFFGVAGASCTGGYFTAARVGALYA
jgi:hypothetical protein